MCSFGSRSKPETEASDIQTDRRKRLAAYVLLIILVGCMNAHQLGARGRQGRKLNSKHFFCSRVNEGTLGSGKEREVRAT